MMSSIVAAILIYHRHKPVDRINLLSRNGDVTCFLWGIDKPIDRINLLSRSGDVTCFLWGMDKPIDRINLLDP
jgi:hypothetical protein